MAVWREGVAGRLANTAVDMTLGLNDAGASPAAAPAASFNPRIAFATKPRPTTEMAPIRGRDGGSNFLTQCRINRTTQSGTPATAGPNLFALPVLRCLSQAHPGATTVPIDELHAGGFQCATNCRVIGGGHRRLSFSQLGSSDCGDAESGLAGEVFSTPAEQGAGSSDLGTGQRLCFHIDIFIPNDMLHTGWSDETGLVSEQTPFSIVEEVMKSLVWTRSHESRRAFIGGSDARIIMGSDEAALVRLWREKRGEAEPEDLSGNLIVQLGRATEDLNRSWYERNTGRQVLDMQRHVRHSAIYWMAATLDGIVEGTEAVFEAKFMLPWSFSEETAAEKYMAQLQHNMWVTNLRSSVLSIITGGGKWVELTIPMDSLYLSVLVSAEKKFWRCVQSGEPPHLINAEPPRPRIEAVRIVDMSASNSWAEFAALFRNTRNAFLDHERAKSELKALMPDDAKEAIGHGVKAKRSKSGAVSFDLLETEATHAPVQ
jgi:predicted phage-related endonuclease